MASASADVCDWRRSRWLASELSAQREAPGAAGSSRPSGHLTRRASSGSVTGSGSPTGIAWSPRRTTICGERVLPLGGGVRVDGRTAEEGRAQHPALAVDADDARRLGRGRAVGTLDRHLAHQLGAPATFALGGLAAASRHVLGDLRADLGPQVAVAGGREGLELAGAVGAGQHDRPDLRRSARRPGAGSSRSAMAGTSTEPRSARSTPSPSTWDTSKGRWGRPVDGGVRGVLRAAVARLRASCLPCGGTSRQHSFT